MCTPLIDECEGFKPSSTTYRFYLVTRIINSGISDYDDDLDLSFSASKMLIVNDDETILTRDALSYDKYSRRRLDDGLETSLSVRRNGLRGGEDEIIETHLIL